MGRNHRRAQISNSSIIAVILLFCRIRTWFPWTLLHEATFICEYEVHYFPLNCLLFLFALTSIPTYVYRVLLEGSKRSFDEKGDFATSWNAAGIGLKCALALPLCGCANTPTTGGPGCPSTEMKNLLNCQGVLASKYSVPAGPRVTKALTFRQYLLNWFFSICFYLNTKKYLFFFRSITKKGTKRTCSLKSLLVSCEWLLLASDSSALASGPRTRSKWRSQIKFFFFFKIINIWKKLVFQWCTSN